MSKNLSTIFILCVIISTMTACVSGDGYPSSYTNNASLVSSFSPENNEQIINVYKIEDGDTVCYVALQLPRYESPSMDCIDNK